MRAYMRQCIGQTYINPTVLHLSQPRHWQSTDLILTAKKSRIKDMILDGKALADTMLTTQASQVATLKQQGITPHLAVILVGDDPGSLSFIKQKQKTADRIGAILTFEHLPATTSAETLASAIAHYNENSSVHGLIVQRPVPIPNSGDIVASVSPSKDVDGFVPNSLFEVPVARAVLTLLEHVHHSLSAQGLADETFAQWLTQQTISVIGRGETAGKPIATMLQKHGAHPHIIHSQTKTPEAMLRESAIIISCVGKPNAISVSSVTPGAILISVGLWRDEKNKLHGDYDEEKIRTKAGFYTPTPGGVGPVNVASLMQNLIDACILQTQV
jgi:methylenetetrahydrofolate dehydrogenase (NADP+) / methenyltetrahydrofolate cyclohydrolase